MTTATPDNIDRGNGEIARMAAEKAIAEIDWFLQGSDFDPKLAALKSTYAASDYAKDGATFAEWLHDETYVCEVCETRHADWSKFASNVNKYAYHTLVCDDCAEGVDAAAYHRETV